MRQISITLMMILATGGCAAIDEPATSEQQSAVTQLMGETFDQLASGNVDGQNGWIGNCTVTDGVAPDKYLKCVGDRNATKAIGLHGTGSYTMLVDIGPNANVENTTHGKISLEGPQGRAFQLLVGCDNIRVAFQMNGPVATLASFDCGERRGPPSYRVVCNWSTSGTVLSCGAARKPLDPTSFVDLALPGATLFDKIYIWQN